MSKVIITIVSIIIMLFPFVFVGWALYYMRVKIKLKRSRLGFMNGSRSEFESAVKSYEKIYSIQTDTSTETFKEWRRKNGYLREFVNFDYNKLGLDKEYLKVVRAYMKYAKQ